MTAPLNERIFVALDVPTASEATKLVGKLASIGVGFKLGPHFLLDSGFSQFVDGLCGIDNGRFIDLKHLDIPATVTAAISKAGQRRFNYATVHAQPATMRAAVDAAKDTILNILAVTVLTSFSANDAAEFYNDPGADDRDLISALVEQRVAWAEEAGCHGIICSPWEVSMVRRLAPAGFIIGVPGITPSGNERDDHNRIGTPRQAIEDGADFLVIGRPIIQASDPAGAVCRIIEQMK